VVSVCVVIRFCSITLRLSAQHPLEREGAVKGGKRLTVTGATLKYVLMWLWQMS
jgi:hypothetical protein